MPKRRPRTSKISVAVPDPPPASESKRTEEPVSDPSVTAAADDSQPHDDATFESGVESHEVEHASEPLETGYEIHNAADQYETWPPVASEPLLEGNDVKLPEPSAPPRPRRTGVKTIVQFKGSEGESWRETVDVLTVSRTGAGLWLARPCPVGRIMNLVMEMPEPLRVYDRAEPLYAVAGVVQNCAELREEGEVTYHVGVAFIGKQLPESFKADPTTTYRITGVDEDGLWTVAEIRAGFREREHARYWAEIPMAVTYRNEHEKKIERAAVQTRDISRGGMAVWGPLRLAIGEKIKVTSKDHDFFTVATVKNRTDDPQEASKSLIHVQFDEEFPVDMISEAEPKGSSRPK